MEFGSIHYAVEGAEPTPYALKPGVTTIGSAADNDVILDSIAAYQLRLICSPDTCWVMNIDDSVPVFLNYVRIQKQTRYPLTNNDIIRVGSYFVLYSHTPPKDDQLPVARRRGSSLPPDIVSRMSSIDDIGRRTRLPARQLPGNRDMLQPSSYINTARTASSYLQYLPGIYQEQDFLGRMLLIFEHILEPIDRMVGDMAFYFDPRTAPKAMLPWLASWLDLVLNENWPLERRRALILAAAELYRWRGTKKGLINYLRIYTGVTPTIIEPQDSAELADYTFKVELTVPKGSSIDERFITMIIEAEKPAHTTFILEISEAV